MIRTNIYLNNIDKVKLFVGIASKQEADIDLVSGRYLINAKSIMGIFSLDLSRPIEMIIHSNDESIKDAFKDFLY